MASLTRSAPGTDREPYSHAQLQPLVAPRSVAILGASARPASLGARVAANLLRGAVADGVHLVNPRYEELDGRPCLPDLSAVGSPVDCVVVAVPVQGVVAALEQCAEAGARSAIVYASGFAETGDREAADLQARLAAIAREADMRVCGPNCVGLINLADDIELQFLPAFGDEKVVGRVGLATQSGALGYTALQAQYRGVGFSRGLMPGNSCDVDVVDFMNYLVDDPATDVIAAVFEGVNSGERLRAVAQRAWEAGKPIVAQKLGSGDVSGAAARSHTGSMIGFHRVFEAAFDRLGIVGVADYEALVETAQFFVRAGVARSEGVAIVSGSGGSAILAADQAERAGLAVPQPSDAARSTLGRLIPAYGSTANPADLTSDLLGDQEGYRACLHAFADDPQYGVLVFPQTAAGRWITAERAHVLSDVAATMAIPLVVVWMSEWLQGPGAEVLESDERIAVFRSARRASEALAAWMRWSRERGRTPAADGPAAGDPVPAAAARLSARLRDLPPGGALDERDAKDVLATLGLARPPHAVASSADEAATATERLGGPVALKILSEAVTHKARIGGVELGIDGAEAARAAYARIGAAVAAAGHAGTTAVLVEGMAPPDGLELIVGARRDPHFGPVVLVGLGGSGVEAMDEREHVVGIAPLSPSQARELVARLPQTGHVRAAAAVLEALLVRVGALMAATPELSELEVNPLLVDAGGGAIALDAVIVRDVAL